MPVDGDYFQISRFTVSGVWTPQYNQIVQYISSQSHIKTLFVLVITYFLLKISPKYFYTYLVGSIKK